VWYGMLCMTEITSEQPRLRFDRPAERMRGMDGCTVGHALYIYMYVCFLIDDLN